MRIPGIFRADKIYSISVGVSPSVLSAFNIYAYNPATNAFDGVFSSNLTGPGFKNASNQAYQPPAGYTDLILGTTIGGQNIFTIKHLSITFDEPVQVSDSDMRWAGRRTSYYGGTKISSLDVNVDSNETVDGGPVVVINTVNSNTPTAASMPLDTAAERAVDPGRALVNRTSYQGVAPYVQTVTEGRRLVNVSGQPVIQSSDRIGRALVNYGGQPIVNEGRALFNRANS